MGNQPSNVADGGGGTGVPPPSTVTNLGGPTSSSTRVTGPGGHVTQNQGSRYNHSSHSQHPHSGHGTTTHPMHGTTPTQSHSQPHPTTHSHAVPYATGPYGPSMGNYTKSSSDASMGEDSSLKRLPFGAVSSQIPPRQNYDAVVSSSVSMDIHHHPATVHDPSVQANIAQLSIVEEDVVPTVFRWEHGGRDVYITGTFNGWTRQIPMHRSGNDFTYIHNLKRGKHAYKFIVDDEWRFAPDQPTVADVDGRINNFIDVTEFKPYTGDKSFETEKNAAYYCKPHANGDVHGRGGSGGSNSMAMAMNDDDMVPDNMSNVAQMQDPDGEIFTHNMPDLDEYTKDPPPLPPHLRHIILNKPPQLQDTAALPVPQHVALNHLYCTAIRDNMMVLGITQRFRTKFVTTVYYAPELSRPM